MTRLFYDGECQSCYKRWSYRTITDMNMKGCLTCQGLVIPLWVIREYNRSEPGAWEHKSPWWTFDDVSDMYVMSDISEYKEPTVPKMTVDWKARWNEMLDSVKL